MKISIKRIPIIIAIVRNNMFLNQTAGLSFTMNNDFGSYNIEAAIVPFMTKISTFIIIGSLLISFKLLLITFSRGPASIWQKDRKAIDSLKSTHLAHANPGIFILFVLLFLILSVSFSVVFSPQYLIWFNLVRNATPDVLL